MGWKHPLARMGPLPETIALVYAPRDDEKIETVLSIVQEWLDNTLATEEK